MREIEPDMVLGKEAVDREGSPLGEIVDVGLYTHSRVKFLVVRPRDVGGRARTVAVDAIDAVGSRVVKLSVV